MLCAISMRFMTVYLDWCAYGRSQARSFFPEYKSIAAAQIVLLMDAMEAIA